MKKKDHPIFCRSYYTSLASTSLAVMFGIIAAALFGQIGVDLSICSVGSDCYKHRKRKHNLKFYAIHGHI